ncbi:Porphobilinogen deaminase [Podosphaera aphanis]|nr:Porphobilinogen deaminase [Podosphaera aphanis]
MDNMQQPSESRTRINIGTRRSALALVQAEMVCDALKKAHPAKIFEIHAMATMGDKNQVTALSEFGAKSLWTYELEAQLLEGKLDLVVHCLKDMPTRMPKNCTIGCIMEREDPRDIVVMKERSSFKSLADLPEGSIVGTSSVRRSAQIKRSYPHLQFKNVRGNIGTRLSKLDALDGEYSCLVLAAAGILRMGLGDRITQFLDSSTGNGHLYAVGQGALAIEVREGDGEIRELLRTLANQDSTLAGMSERSLMRALEGGCSVPIGVESTWIAKGTLSMKAIVVSLDGLKWVEAELEHKVLEITDAENFGQRLAQDLIRKGATEILEEIKSSRPADKSEVAS